MNAYVEDDKTKIPKNPNTVLHMNQNYFLLLYRHTLEIYCFKKF